jgi:glycosyltransferase involved in cell wall biosynthesis
VTLVDRVVVHAGNFIQVLAKEYHLSRQIQKVELIPLGIEIREDGIDREEAKSRLGLNNKQIILFFGNLTGYKGLELLIDSMGFLEKKYDDLVLIIAGGDTPGLRVTAKKAYPEILKERARSVSPNIQFTAFVEENDIGVYFSAADLVVLPYTIGLSSSGPLALSIAYDRPFIVSTALASVVDLDAAIFEPTVQSLVEKIDRFLKNHDLRCEIRDYGLKLKAERSWPRIGEKTRNLYRDCL